MTPLPIVVATVFDIGEVPYPSAERYIVAPVALLIVVHESPLLVLFKKYWIDPLACETVI